MPNSTVMHTPYKFMLACAGTLIVFALSACVPVGTAGKGQAGQDAARIHTQLGQAYMQQGHYADALEKLQKAITYDAHYEPAHTVLAALYDELGDATHAGEHYRTAVAIEPLSGRTNNNYAVHLCRQGAAEQAMFYFDKAMQDALHASRSQLLTNAATCAMENDHLPLAADFLTQALQMHADDPDALHMMAEVLARQQDYFRASAYLQRYLAHVPDNPQALQLGHDIETALGNVQEAARYQRQLQASHAHAVAAQDRD